MSPAFEPIHFSEEQIARRAYQIWEEEGQIHGRDQEYWFRAIEELTQEARGGLEIPE